MASEYDEAIRLATAIIERPHTFRDGRSNADRLARAVLAMAKRLERPTDEEIAGLVDEALELEPQLAATSPIRDHVEHMRKVMQLVARRVAELETERRAENNVIAASQALVDSLATGVAQAELWVLVQALAELKQAEHVGAAGKEAGSKHE